MSNYDPLEATYLLAKAHAHYVPDAHVAGRKAAGEELLKVVEEAAKAAGYTVLDGQGAAVIVAQPGSSAYVAIDNGIVTVGQHGKSPASPRDARLYYNPLLKRFEGYDDDHLFVPVPGEPRKRRSAVAVVAEMILGALNPTL